MLQKVKYNPSKEKHYLTKQLEEVLRGIEEYESATMDFWDDQGVNNYINLRREKKEIQRRTV